MRLALALLAVVAVPTSAPNVDRLILQPTQVGTGYVMLVAAGGKGVKAQRTMNLCGTDYPSERFRTTRLQVNYLKWTAKIGVSNEVVTYRSGGAALAMREVLAHATACPKQPIDSGVKGLPKLTFRVSLISDPKLPPGYVAVKMLTFGTVKGKHLVETSYAVYQRRGNVISGVYSFGADTAAQLTLCLHAAEQSARNLRRGTSGLVSAPTA